MPTTIVKRVLKGDSTDEHPDDGIPDDELPEQEKASLNTSIQQFINYC